MATAFVIRFIILLSNERQQVVAGVASLTQLGYLSLGYVALGLDLALHPHWAASPDEKSEAEPKG